VKRAARWADKTYPRNISSNAGGGAAGRYHEFVQQAKAGQGEKAFRSISAFNGDAEPFPGVMVMRNARFGMGSMAATDCTTDYLAGCWMKNTPATQGVLGGHAACASNATGGPARYKRVVTLITPRTYQYFYHFVTEQFSRISLVLDLLKKHPDIKVAGFVPKKLKFLGTMGRENVKEVLGISEKNLVTPGKEGGCAEYLFIPESVRCLGLDVGLAHSTRGMIKRILRTAVHPPPQGPGSGGGRYVLLIRRGGGAPRSLVNHDEVQQRLNASLKGMNVALEVHTGGNLLHSFAAFHGAQGVIGPHGAALSMILAMRPGRAVVEYMPTIWKGDVANICFLRIAALLGLEYRAVHIPNGDFGKPLVADANAGWAALQDALATVPA